MERKLKLRDYLYLASMLFGLFFGAGNLIFPVHMGQLAGREVFTANLGFLITGIGLPFLGVVAMGVSNSDTVYDLASRVGKPYAKYFTIALYLVIGPFFALPRLATTAFEVGIAPYLSDSKATFALAVFSVLFFILSYFLSRKPNKLVAYIGKFLNPSFLLLLAVLLFLAFTRPIAAVGDIVPELSYQQQAFSNGLLEGYNTLDALAALAFGVLITSTLKLLGVKKPRQLALDTIKAGSLSILAMGIIYTLLAYMGAKSMGAFALSENGGIALAQLSHYYLGRYGSIVLALIVILACLKTAIGLISAFGESFQGIFPNKSYGFFIALAAILATLVANVGLTQIIALSEPVLMFIYPLAIVLILLSLANNLFKGYRDVYVWTTAFTTLAAIIDALRASPLSNRFFVHDLIMLAERYLPFFSQGMGWILPALVGFIVGYLIAKSRPEHDRIQFGNTLNMK